MNLKKPISAAMAAIMSLSVTATPVLAADGDPPNTDTLANDTESVVTLGEQSAAEEERLAAAGQSEQNYQSTTVYSVANTIKYLADKDDCSDQSRIQAQNIRVEECQKR